LYLNKKSCNLAFKSALTYGLNDGKIYFLEGASEIKKPSTKTIASMLKKLNLNGNYLFISNDNKLLRSANNIEDSICRLIKEVSVYDLLNANNIIIQNEQVNLLQERVKK
jgi:ribosomal protein L4